MSTNKGLRDLVCHGSLLGVLAQLSALFLLTPLLIATSYQTSVRLLMGIWRYVLKEVPVLLPNQRTTYLIKDALNESGHARGSVTSRKGAPVFEGTRREICIPNLRSRVTNRPESDFRKAL